MTSLELKTVRTLIEFALKEDIGSGDLTTCAIIPEKMKGLAILYAKESGILAGIDIARLVFECIDKELEFIPVLKDGDRLSYGKGIAHIRGSARSCLTGERVTLTSQFVKTVAGTGAKILDTRKTTPGLRILEKYAVRIGGGLNHRFGLFDQILIKENHIDAIQGIRWAVKKVREKDGRGEFITVEVRSLQGVKEALDAGVQRILLDNMNLEKIRKAVEFIRKEETVGGNTSRHKVEIEVSGRVTLENVREIALTGVDYISVGALTHSAKALDISMRLRTIGR